MGKTEAIFNIIGHRFDDGPYTPALYVGPTEKQVKSISRDRVDKMIKSTPSIWGKTERGQRYGVYEKWISGVRLGFAWAGSATELSTHPCGLVLIDERDRMGSDVSGEGDPVVLASARAKNFPNRKIGVFSTPTIEGLSPTWALFESGEINLLAFPCLGCLEWFIPTLSLLQWPEGITPDEALESAYLVCPGCGSMHKDTVKQSLVGAARFIRYRHAKKSEDTKNAVFGKYLVAEPGPPLRTVGYWMSGLSSPWVSFGETAKKIIEAHKSGQIETIQGVINTYGGELFREQGDAPEWLEVLENKLEIAPREIPRGVQKITLGADVQKYGIYFVIRGWGHNTESWLLDEDYLSGQTDHDAVWGALRNVIDTPIADRPIDRAFIDSGYRPGEAIVRPDHAVYTFCRTFPGLAYPTKGRDTLDKPYYFRAIDYTVGGAVVRGGVKLCHINTDFFKRWIHARIKWPDGAPGGWHLHNQTTEDYARQMVAEELVTRASSGRMVWVIRSKDNHYIDCEVNATCAAWSLNVHKLQQLTDENTGVSSKGDQVSPVPAGYKRRGIM